MVVTAVLVVSSGFERVAPVVLSGDGAVCKFVVVSSQPKVVVVSAKSARLYLLGIDIQKEGTGGGTDSHKGDGRLGDHMVPRTKRVKDTTVRWEFETNHTTDSPSNIAAHWRSIS